MKKNLLIILILIGVNSFAQKSLLRDGNKLYPDSSYNEAEIKYRKSLEKDPDYFNAKFNLADAVYKQEQYSQASSLFNKLKEEAPSDQTLAKVYHNLGNSLVKEGKLDDAINAYKNSLRINPNDNETRHNLALSQKQKKEQQEQEKEDQQKKEEKKDQSEKKEDLSKEDAEKMLEAIQQQEKKLQQELQKKKIKGKRKKVLKDW